jgi:DNA-binding MarR family transcriptional regulator
MFDIETSVGFLLAKAYQRAWALFREELDSYDMTPPQFGLMSFLWQQDGLSQVELSERSQVDRTTMGGLIDRLEKIGMVERQPHPQDRRAYQIRLTIKGKSLELPLTEMAHRATSRFTANLKQDDIAELVRILEILRGERSAYEKPSC